MSAIVSGKRSFFEELSATPPVSKRIRCSSRFISSSFSPSSSSSSPPPSPPSSFLIDQLIVIFPEMDKQSSELNAGVTTANGDVPTKEQTGPEVFSMDGSDWVELFVREMLNASNIDDARARASRALEVLEKSIRARAGAEVAQNFHQENMMLKEQLEALIQENTILKRAVAVQHERQIEYEDQSQELQHLKQLASQYQEQFRTLEVNNYALTMHLKQAQQSSSIPGRFNPNVF
ncbi:hypothetical protein CRYUN_Cryun26dG0082100 [Craigia yunnanensis]